MPDELKWAWMAVLWPPATKEARGMVLSFRQWCMMLGGTFFMFPWSLFVGSFFMSSYDPAGGGALWIGLLMISAAMYFAYLFYAFGWRTKAQ
jgi:hypothetical protein